MYLIKYDAKLNYTLNFYICEWSRINFSTKTENTLAQWAEASGHCVSVFELRNFLQNRQF